MKTPALTKAQHAILTNLVAPSGMPMLLSGRNAPAVDALERAGLITVKWKHEGYPGRNVPTCKPTRKGRDLISREYRETQFAVDHMSMEDD